ncbi:MAG: hypothetical protein KBT11_08600 [Treponema sp.]|nr:hypothetical protein [Candidatus Treponema equifaecale]
MDFRNIDEGHAEGEEPLVFHYNREDRIKNAPDLVKQYYSGELNRKRGLFRVLVSTKGNRFMLFALVVCFIIIGFVEFFGPSSNVDTVSGISSKLTAFSYEDTIYVSLKLEKAGKKYLEAHKDENGVEVFALVQAYDADNQLLFEDKVNGKYEGKDLFLRTSFTDYDIFSIKAQLAAGGEVKNLSCSVEKH